LIKKYLLLIVLFLGVCLPSYSLTTRTWTGATNSDFNTSTNWSPNAVPSSGDSCVLIVSVDKTVTLSADITVGALYIEETGNSKQLSVSANNYTLTIEGDLYVSSSGNGGCYALLSTATSSLISVGRHAYIGNSGSNTAYLYANTTAGSITFKGNLTLGTYAASSAGNESDILFDGTGSQTVTINNSNYMLAEDITIGSSNNPVVTLSNSSSDRFRVYNGNVVINGTSILDISSNSFGRYTGTGTFTMSSGSSLKIGGTGGFPSNLTTTLNSNSNVYYNGTTQTVTNISGGYGNLYIDGTGTKTFASSTMDINGNLTITAGTLATGGFNATVAGNWVNNGTTFTAGTGTVTFDGTSTISGSTTTSFNNVTITGTLTGASGTFNVAGTWSNNGTFTHNSGTVVFNGTAAQTLTGSGSTTFYNLTNSNTSTGLSLGVNTVVNNTLNLNTGLLKTVSYTLTLGTSSANGSISGGGSTNYIVTYNAGTIGYFKQFVNSNTAYSFPIGDISNYTPLTWTLNSNGGLSSAYITTYTKNAPPTGMNSSLTQYINRFWDVTSSGMTTPNYNISYTYVNGDIVGTETGLLPFKITGSTVVAPTNSTFTNVSSTAGTGSVTTASNLLSWTGLTTFSMFGGAVDGAVALPVELLSFEAKPYQGNVKVNWKTANELDNDFFNVERSFDGIDFNLICEVDGAGNSNHVISYFYIDNEFQKGVNYYRLRQTDFNGKTTLSKIVSIDMSKQTGGIVMTVNSLGQEVNETYNGIVFDIYADGSSVKRIQ
ncbi:MAG: hypothetical protein HYR91_00400, partial [Flavobacteriia bacterium]|nr:hypothetical protein [Flavobacteriia bacterium]